MRRAYSFGKVAYNGKRKINEVTLEIELRNWNGYPEFTAHAMVWNNIHTDIVAGGQMIDDLYNRFAVLRDSVLYKTIMQLWEKYHLHAISDIPAEDQELIDLLVSNKGRKEIEGILKSRFEEIGDANYKYRVAKLSEDSGEWEVQASFKTERQAHNYVAFMRGKRYRV